MSNIPQLNQAQRKAFETTLNEGLRNAREALSQKMEDAKTVTLQKLIEETPNVRDLAVQAIDSEKKLEESTKALKELGFRLDRSNELAIDYDAPDALREVYDKLIEDHVAVESAKVDTIRAAIQKAWQIGTLAEAKQLVESFAS